MKKIAMCIPTKNRPEMISRVMRLAPGLYSKYPINVYYYDSSDNEETERIIKPYLTQYSNLHYVRMDPDISVERKVAMMFAGYGWTERYDYLWPVKDRVRFRESTLDAVMESAERNLDVIFLGGNPRHAHGFQSEESYDADPMELYWDWGWVAADMQRVIFRLSSMLGEDFTVENFERVCVYDYNIYWIQHFWLFHRLAQMPESKIRILMGDEGISYSYQHGKSEWERRVLKVWKEDWIKMNEGLPEIYDASKSKVILEGSSAVGILGSVDRIKELRDSGILTEENLEDALVDWERVSDVPPAVVRDVVCGVDESHDVSLLAGKAGDVGDFIIKMVEMLRQGSLGWEQVPFGKIMQSVRKGQKLNNRLSVAEGVLAEGVLTDMERYADGAEMTSESMQGLLQCLLLLVSLMERRTMETEMAGGEADESI